MGMISLVSGQTTLTYSTCEAIKTTNHSCSYAYTYWGRDFKLDDFNINQNEEFTITKGQFALSYTSSPVYLSFNIYAIDNNFPASFDQATLLGSSQEILVPPYIVDYLPVQFFTIDFDDPVVVPAGTQRILVEVQKGAPTWGSGLAHIAGTALDTGISWQRDCATNYEYVNADDHVVFGEINNYYITVTGTKLSTTVPFTMNISNNCSDFFKGFTLNNNLEITSVLWDFGDPNSGASNSSTEINPKHDFSADGIYTVTVKITDQSGIDYTLQEMIDVREPPEVYSLPNLIACENTFASGIASTFDTSIIEQQILRGRSNLDITYLDGNGDELPNPLPNPMTNSILNLETIAVRVAYSDEPCCYSETTFDLIVNPLPDLSLISDLVICDDNEDGYASFDLDPIQSIIKSQTNLTVDFFHEDGSSIDYKNSSVVVNKIPYEEIITVLATNSNTGCRQKSTFKLIVSPQPIAYTLPDVYGCDDNNDGISEYFDTSTIESSVLGNQTDMQVSYYDSAGNTIPSPLPNPFTNSIPEKEKITVRITNAYSGCYNETSVNFITSKNPQISKPSTIYTCDSGNGYASSDTSTWNATIVGNQNDLQLSYYDKLGNELPNPLPPFYENTEPWSQTLNVRVENKLNSACYSETTIELEVNRLPQLSMQTEYLICNNEPSLILTVPSGFESYLWKYNNIQISNSNTAELENTGIYSLTVSQLKNGLVCERSIDINLARSEPPVITSVNFDELGNNYVKINADGDGDFEYSIDGINFQSNNSFYGISGGNYTTYVRDREGCGYDSKNVTLIDYPKFFTPNGDGYNDYWQIEGISNYTKSEIRIFNRYGKLIKQLSPKSNGWSGNFNGSLLPSDDYWFSVDLKDGRIFNGHFTLKH